MAQIAFIGAGRMASAMIGGIVNGKHLPASDIGCTCGADPTGAELAARTGIHYIENAADLVSPADTVVLACKPQQFDDLGADLTAAASGKLIISILAGTTLARIKAKFPAARNHVRVMPNTPGQIGAGISAFAAASALAKADRKVVEMILGAMGETVELPEAQIDAVTAVSGSGPAYLFEFTAALRAAGVQAGLDEETAHRLAMQTIIGSAKLLEQSGEDPETLRNNVTSPNGTTQAALESFAAANLRGIVANAVEAAKKRSIELAG